MNKPASLTLSATYDLSNGYLTVFVTLRRQDTSESTRLESISHGVEKELSLFVPRSWKFDNPRPTYLGKGRGECIGLLLRVIASSNEATA